MKHLLNDLSSDEKNRIREQYEGGMSVDTSKFKNLVETKLGDPKPLVNEDFTIDGVEDFDFPEDPNRFNKWHIEELLKVYDVDGANEILGSHYPGYSLEINASRENSVDVIRDKITNFVQMIPFGPFKVVLLDEADSLPHLTQAALRTDMETYSDTVRFILTCNYPDKIIPALRESRCHKIHISKPDHTDFTARAAKVLLDENIDFDIDTLDNYVRVCYPDLRKMLNQLQVNSIGNKLQSVPTGDTDENELLMEAVKLFKAGKVLDGRQQLMQY